MYGSIPLLQIPQRKFSIPTYLPYVIFALTILVFLLTLIQGEQIHDMEILLPKCATEIVDFLNHRSTHAVFGPTVNADQCKNSHKTKTLPNATLQGDEGFTLEWFEPEKHFFTKARMEELFDNSNTMDEFDWTPHFKSPIKDQGHSGSCWTFASAEAVEAALWVSGDYRGVRVSIQQLLDCFAPTCDNPANPKVCCFMGKCGYITEDSASVGGMPEDAMIFFSREGFSDARKYPYVHSICKQRQLLGPGIANSKDNFKMNCESSDFCYFNETQYDDNTAWGEFGVHRGPQFCQNYHADGGLCQKGNATPIGKVNGMVLVSYTESPVEEVRGMDEELMKEALVQLGPLVVAMNAGPMLHYQKGILDLDEEACDPTDIDHNLLLVGYGSQKGVDYWKIRNSWGPFFGEDGYIRVKRGSNVCGVASGVFAAII